MGRREVLRGNGLFLFIYKLQTLDFRVFFCRSYFQLAREKDQSQMRFGNTMVVFRSGPQR